MKKLFRGVLPIAAFCAALILTSCLPSDVPLTDENTCHDERLEGSWIKQEKNSQESIEIADEGKSYTLKTDKETNSFTLTQLGSHFFMSYLTKDGGYLIFRIEFDEAELRFFGLTEAGMKLAENEVFTKDKQNKIHTKLSQAELREWCLEHAGDFASEPIVYRKAAAEE